MLLDDAVVGALSVWRNDVSPFGEREMAIVSAFAVQAAMAVNQVKLVQLLQDAPQWRKVNLTGVLQADGAASGRDRFTMTAELQPLPAAAPTPEAADADAKRTP